MNVGNTVRFTSNSRHDDWEKGDLAEIEQIAALHPLNQFDIYILRKKESRQLVWATTQDIEVYEQLILF